MTTEADCAISHALMNIEHVITHLSKVSIERVSGTEDLNSEYRAKIRQSLVTLLEIREALTL